MTAGARVVGRSLTRIDAPGKVTGSAVYAADFALPGMLCGKVFRSTEAHARLVKVDTTRASRIPGVRAVVTAADAADVRYGAAVKDEPVFASDIVRYRGQAVAAVAATTLAAAEAALAAIEVAYEPLPPVFDPALETVRSADRRVERLPVPAPPTGTSPAAYAQCAGSPPPSPPGSAGGCGPIRGR